MNCLEIYPSDLEKWYKSSDPFAGVFLYNLDEDPAESNNLADKYPELVKELLREAEESIEDAPPQQLTAVRMHKNTL